MMGSIGGKLVSRAVAVMLLVGAVVVPAGSVQAQAAQGELAGVSVSSEVPGTVLITWELPDPLPADYRIDWAKANEEFTSWKVDEGHLYPEGSETSVTVSGLEPGERYKVRMRARYHGPTYAERPWSGPWTDEMTVVAAAGSTRRSEPDSDAGKDQQSEPEGDPDDGDVSLPPPVIVEVTEPEQLVTAQQSSDEDAMLLSTLESPATDDRWPVGRVSADAVDRQYGVHISAGRRIRPGRRDYPLGFELTGVTVEFYDPPDFASLTSSVVLKAHIHSATQVINSGPYGRNKNIWEYISAPGGRVATVGEAAVNTATGAGSGTKRLLIEADTDIPLDTDSSYYVVLELDGNSAGETIELVAIRTIDQPISYGEAGWSFSKGRYRHSASHSWIRPISKGGVVRLALHGKLAPSEIDSSCTAASVADESQAVNIPDTALRAAVEEALDKSSGSTISYAELATVLEIDAVGKGITSMEGLQYANRLLYLNLQGNNIPTLIDFCGMPLLEYLNLSENRINGSIDLTDLGRLQTLSLERNHLTSVAMPSSNPRLRVFSVFQNNISSVTWGGVEYGAARPPIRIAPQLHVTHSGGANFIFSTRLNPISGWR